MDLKGLSDNTKKAYLQKVQHFGAHFKALPEQLGETEIRDYLHHEITQRKLKSSSVAIGYAALKFFFKTTLGRTWEDQSIPRMKRGRPLPNILAKEEILQLFNATNNLKHRAVLMVAYSAGLRVSEIANLKIADIDSKNMQIIIKQGKGNVDRYSLLSENTLAVLRSYYKQYKPQYWLFPGQYPAKPINPRSLGCIFRDAKRKVGIKKNVTIHSLRHSFATHLMEDNVHLCYIQKLLGHKNIRTTCVYLHLTRLNVLQIKSPLDTMPGLSDG